MNAPLKTLSLLLAVGYSSVAFAVPPCENGSNDQCHWTCTDDVYDISCFGGGGIIEACYQVDNTSGVPVACNADCDTYTCFSSTPFNPMTDTSVTPVAPEREVEEDRDTPRDTYRECLEWSDEAPEEDEPVRERARR